ncbi:nuclear transport factor 2 family protein [Pseudonocardia xishanensis]|uniref:Nuclear transport factor 2 family protein n=2 Tax=Pseudonocardia xishanensis TaxID=630995 RepID=A0ABP8RPZ7_9PSEU
MATVEERLTRLEDIEAIRRLKSRYCNACDDGHDADAVATIFAPDAVWESTDHGPHRGHDEIRAAFQGFGQAVSFSQHNTTNLDIEVHGDRAVGTWHFIGVLDFHEAPAALGSTRYEEEYVKLDGEWRIQHLRAVRLAVLPIIGLRHRGPVPSDESTEARS